MLKPVLISLILGGISFVGTSCGRPSAASSLPAQKSLDLGPDPSGIGAFVTMEDPAADDYIVRDISPAPGLHRWALRNPELRFRLDGSAYSKFAAEFAIVESTFKATGPLTVSAIIQGNTVGTILCDHPGDYRIERPVPAGLLPSGEEIHVRLESSRRWVSPDDGAELSFYLKNAGFVR